MPPFTFNENDVEQAALSWLTGVGWTVGYGPDTAAERQHDYGQVVLEERLRTALARLNPQLPAAALADAQRRLTRPEGASLLSRNRFFHRMLVDGIPVEYRDANGSARYDRARVVDFDDPAGNSLLAVNQFTVIENRQQRRVDIVLFVNGLPLGVIELKNAVDAQATLRTAWQQLQTYQTELPALFCYNELLIVSDGTEARVGALGANWEWFKPWRTTDGAMLAPRNMPQLQVIIEGLLYPERLLAMVRDFIVFEDDGGGPVKKLAGYHQFHAVLQAVNETLRAADLQNESRRRVEEYSSGRYAVRASTSAEPGDRRIGVIWHTQGAGKSLTMVFYAGCIIREPALGNPTLVVLTDRIDLDNQLFSAFARCADLLRQPPTQAGSRADLRSKLDVASGGVVFTTIQKFFEQTAQHPIISDRGNIVVIADEAHRSQYDFVNGYAGQMRDALPNASFIGFTGTPIEKADANTRAVFGDDISVYDIRRAVADGATVPIYYESRQAKLALDESELPRIDTDFEEATEGEELERKESLKTRWAQLEAIVGADRRLNLLASDIAAHFDGRQEALAGKGMVVCMSRRICVALYEKLVALRPEWHSDDDGGGTIKVVMTGSASDPTAWQAHIRTKDRRERLAGRFRNPDDSLQIVLVRDMWLTGFDAPSLHTMYVDKPMRDHGLMQAIARVNRVFKDKPGGLVVDYLGLATELQKALATYVESGGQGNIKLDQNAAVSLLLEKYEVCCSIMHGFDWNGWSGADPTIKIRLLADAQEHILAQQQGKERFVRGVLELTRAFALAVPHEATLRIRSEVAFLQSIRASLEKQHTSASHSDAELDHAIRQIIDRAVAPDEVVDIFSAAGLAKPDLAILSEEFLAEVRSMPRHNLAVELLRKLLNGEIVERGRRNVVQARSFTQLLRSALRKYENRTIAAAEVIEELIELAREIRKSDQRGAELELSDDELAFYDALETNDSTVAVMGNTALREIARELVSSVRSSTTVDWQYREDARAQLRVTVRRILRRRGYPPDKQETTTQTVLEQAELLSHECLNQTAPAS